MFLYMCNIQQQNVHAIFLDPCGHRTHFSYISHDGCSIANAVWETHGLLGHISPSRVDMIVNVSVLVCALAALHQEGYIHFGALYFERTTRIMKITEIKSPEELKVIKLRRHVRNNQLSVPKDRKGSPMGKFRLVG